jgi:hypothetical protein
MTRDEHLMVLTMLARQQMQIKLILDVLRSREIVSGDDLKAFDFAVRQDAESKLSLLRQVKEVYLAAAAEVGLETGIKPEE